jgi:hypothetical protein
MPILTTLKEDSPYLEELPASFSLASEAMANKAMHENPITRLYRYTGVVDSGYQKVDSNPLARKYIESPLIPAEDARKKVTDLGIKLDIPDQGITSNQLDYLIENKKLTQQYDSVLSRASQSFGTQAALTAVNFAVSSMDPINIASAFIPVYGEARYTSMLANAASPIARAMVRGRVGLAEGLVGAAAVEPLNYALARHEQADYHFTDMLENIAFGGILGSGLHAGVGALADAFTKHGTIKLATPDESNGALANNLPPDIRNAAIKTAISQLMDGRYVDVEHILNMASGYEGMKRRLLESTSMVDPFAPKPDFKPLSPDIVILKPGEALPPIAPFISDKKPSAKTFGIGLTSEGQIRTFNTIEEVTKIQDNVLRRSGENLQIKQLPDGSYTLLREFEDKPLRDGNGSLVAFNTERAASKAVSSTIEYKGRDFSPVPFVTDGKIKYALVENASPEFIQSSKTNPDMVSFEADKTNIPPSTIAAQTPEQMAFIQRAARNSVALDKYRLTDITALNELDKVYQNIEKMIDRPIDVATAEKEANEYTQLIREQIAQRGTPEELAELDAGDAFIKETESYMNAVKAAFNCTLRRGM